MPTIRQLDKYKARIEGVKIVTIGNSKGIIIPSQIIDSWQLDEEEYIAEVILKRIKNDDGWD